MDPMSDAEALAAAQAASQAQQGRDSTPSSPERAHQEADEAQAKADALGNEQLVWEMLYNPDYSLPTADAVAAWHRAMGKEVEEEEVRRVPVLVDDSQLTCACQTLQTQLGGLSLQQPLSGTMSSYKCVHVCTRVTEQPCQPGTCCVVDGAGGCQRCGVHDP
jgi:hypothetical protein